MRFAVILFGLLLLSGCASTTPTQVYRPAGESAQWMIDGEMTGALDVKIRINGQEVMSGGFSLFGMTTELSGKFQGKELAASCVRITRILRTPMTQCTVLVNNERATVLQF